MRLKHSAVVGLFLHGFELIYSHPVDRFTSDMLDTMPIGQKDVIQYVRSPSLSQ